MSQRMPKLVERMLVELNAEIQRLGDIQKLLSDPQSVDILCNLLYGQPVEKAPVPAATPVLRAHGPRKYKQRVLKDLGDCPIHKVNQRHPRTNRCLLCWADLHPKKSGAAADRKMPPPARLRTPATMVWSQSQAFCLICGTRVVRFHRSTKALPEHFWVHDRPSPFAACMLQISKNQQIKDDPGYEPEAGRDYD